MKNNLNVIDLIIVDTSKEVINTDEGPNEQEALCTKTDEG